MSVMSKERKPPASKDAPKPSRDGIQLNIWLEVDLGLALNQRLKVTRRTKTEEVSIALEEYLAKHGNWPLPKNSHVE